MAEKQCRDCGLEISARAKRCRPCASKSNWEKPGFRDNIAAAVKANWQESPGRRREASESQRARWQDPEFCHRVTEGGRASWQDLKRRHKASELAKTLWQDPEYRQKISTSAKMRWEDPECRRKMSVGLNASRRKPEYRRKRSKIAKKKWRDPEYRRKVTEASQRTAQDPEYRQKLSVKLRAAHARGCYDGICQSPTSIELSLAAALDVCGIVHQSQYRPDGCCFIFDEFIAPNILIEANGDYWHGPKRPENQERDKEKAMWAEGHGFILIVMWEHEINKRGAWSLVHKHILSLL